jgi:hypothetical protein
MFLQRSNFSNRDSSASLQLGTGANDWQKKAAPPAHLRSQNALQQWSRAVRLTLDVDDPNREESELSPTALDFLQRLWRLKPHWDPTLIRNAAARLNVSAVAVLVILQRRLSERDNVLITG